VQTVIGNLLKFSVQDKGAELCSIISQSTGTEFMWGANPDIWGSFAPILFPIIGTLKEGEFLYEGKSYSVPKHGFIRNNENLKVNQVSDNCLEYSLKFDDESLKFYPFEFEFVVRFVLVGNSITIEHKVVNHSKDKPLFFSVGGHPAFKCPLYDGETYEDYFLEFEEVENVSTWEVLTNGLINSTTKSLIQNSNVLPLTRTLFENDALILKDLKSKRVSLKSKKSSSSISIEYTDFNYLGIWAKPGGQFVCIEPWLGISDSNTTDKDFTKKEGIIRLEANTDFKASYYIKIEE
jgi:galactose mutarotase-like enzyme